MLPKSKLLEDSDMLLLTLMKIRLNPPQKDLAYRFGISESSVTTYIHSAIPALAKKLTFLIHWPEREEVMSSRPQCFKETYPKCVSIIDCTKVFIAAPADFEARNATYSSYKHTHTVKFLVSITPAGAVSFVSPAYPGKISDKVLTNDCGYLDFIQHGDVILADRGFLIGDELNELGAELVIPAFTRGKSQLSARDVESGRKISNVRIHVERAMERLKNFRILSDRMHSNMVPHADSIMTISAAIMNLHPNLVN
ncbi:uncharacterized protein LOC128228371 [Mya arenaria]|uniref:uncharacterized protein LOC128228371 n=1 Tax=Mya arenaria TaxID=6604 RepID=UPI0022DF18F2|nr:uncharacterized protein LOC128228371 [Mya arenaria]